MNTRPVTVAAALIALLVVLPACPDEDPEPTSDTQVDLPSDPADTADVSEVTEDVVAEDGSGPDVVAHACESDPFGFGTLPEGPRVTTPSGNTKASQFLEKSDGVTVSGADVFLEPKGGSAAWVTYRYAVEEGRVPSGIVFNVADIEGPYWVGLSDYGDTGCFEWRGPFESEVAVGFWHGGDKYLSSVDNIYWVVLVPDGSTLTLHESTVYTRKPGAPAIITTIYSEEAGGHFAVRVKEPPQPRFEDGAPPVIIASGWFAGVKGFNDKFDYTDIGMVDVSYLWPGTEDTQSGAVSDGTWDNLGPTSIAAKRDAIRFACGEITDSQGSTIHDLTSVTVLTDLTGMYASSHPGVGATNVLAYEGEDLGCVKYLIGRENPTRDEMYPLEIGHWDEDNPSVVVDHGHYQYPKDFSATMIKVDYDSAGWTWEGFPEGRPYLVRDDGSWHVFGSKGPSIDGVRYFSRALTAALEKNDAFAPDPWPARVATLADTVEFWPYRVAVDGEHHNSYEAIGTKLSSLKVMLLFAADDHVQTAWDKPHVHQAWIGFKETAGLDFVRMNPDKAYMALVAPEGAPHYFERPANKSPDDWSDVRPWGYPNEHFTLSQASDAAVAEMVDRVRADNWTDDLDGPL